MYVNSFDILPKNKNIDILNVLLSQSDLSSIIQNYQTCQFYIINNLYIINNVCIIKNLPIIYSCCFCKTENRLRNFDNDIKQEVIKTLENKLNIIKIYK